MTKKGPLSKAEKFYIENHTDVSIDTLCKDLDRAKSTVNKFLKTLPAVNEEKLGPTPIASKDSLTMSQFARNGQGSTVMTENASMHGDEFRSKSKPQRTTKCTVRIVK